jgi:hypothetical protein
LSGKNETWEKMCVEIQRRSLDNISLEIKSTKILRAEILKVLTAASNEKLLKCKIHEIQTLLKLRESSVMNKKGYSEVMGGEKNFRRDKNIAHFKLNNGCWFDFAITINETTKPAQIIGFDFELRFPENLSTSFLRIDLNLPNHNNELQNMRFHLHPGHDDIMIHSPPMSPIEILHLFLYGIDIPDKIRA